MLTRIEFIAAGVLLLFIGCAHADAPSQFTLEEARDIALRNSPSLRAAIAERDAAERVVTQRRADYFPQLSADATTVKTDPAGTRALRNGVEQQLGSYVTAGALNTSTLLDRTAAGVQLKQLVTDFGKTGNLVDSAKSSYRAAAEVANTVRAKVLFDVTEAYFRALQAEATVRIAQKTFDDRRLELEKIALLAKNKLKSALDVSFANVALEQGKVLLLQAQNDFEASSARLAFAMGYAPNDSRTFSLADTGQPELPVADMAPLIYRAVHARPELARQRALYDASTRYARAQRANNYPTFSILAAAGNTFSGDSRLPNKYAAVGLNMNIPLFAGGRYTAQEEEAVYRADAALDDLTDLENGIVKDVQIAWLNCRADYQALSASERLRNYAEQALELAQSRYNLGLSSIVELNTAQLNAIEAEIRNVKARYEYKIDMAKLAYQTGAL